ncbi:hypothetical protein E4T50_03211 [Aureobasidium sp. EXF-12298]|nr:hypothetical protein E4T50_03211 [Aureobasidium sp. EXF-12298]
MPPSIAHLAQEPETDLTLLLTNAQNEQRNFAQRLDILHESQQELLKKLNAIKTENYIQEINGLRAEKQLLQQDSGIFSGEDAPDTTPRKTFLLSSVKNKRKALVDGIDDSGNSTRRIKTESASKSDQGLKYIPTINQSRVADAGSSADMSDVTVWLNPDTLELELAEDEDKATSKAWESDGGRLREQWKKQLKEFNKKNPEWPNNVQTAGCVRSALWNQSKCYLTKEHEGDYACKTCWNTGHFCVAWDKNSGDFWLRPQLPAARAKGKSNIGPFDLEMFHSMKTTPSRTDLPAYWKKEFTS